MSEPTCGYLWHGPTGIAWRCIAAPHGPEQYPNEAAYAADHPSAGGGTRPRRWDRHRFIREGRAPMSSTEKDLADLREVTRAAHEATQDLRAALREVKPAIAAIEQAARRALEEGMTAAVEAGLVNYQESLAAAIRDATEAVFDRFDRIANMLLGASRANPGGEIERLAESMVRLRAADDAGRAVQRSHPGRAVVVVPGPDDLAGPAVTP